MYWYGCQAQKINANGKYGMQKSYMQAKKEVIKSNNEKVKEVGKLPGLQNVESPELLSPWNWMMSLLVFFPWKVRS